MATTDPGHGPHDPVGGLTQHEPPGQPTPDAADPPGAPAAEVVARGHEADVYHAWSVFSVPVLVFVFFVLAFVVTSALFSYFETPPANPGANPQAVARNTAPLNERLARLGRGKEIDQPRLEPLKEMAGQERAITAVPVPGVNSPELHPEDIFPSPTNTPALFKSGTVDAGKPGARTTITIDEAIKRSVQPNALPARKGDEVSRPLASWHVPTAANAGRGAGESEVIQPLPPVAPMPKPVEEKKGDKK